MIFVFGSSSWCSHTVHLYYSKGLVWLFLPHNWMQREVKFSQLVSRFSWSTGLFSLSRWVAASSCSEVGCRRLQILHVLPPLRSLDKWRHLRHSQQGALAWASFFLSVRGFFGNLTQRSSSWFSLQKRQMTHFVLLVLVLAAAVFFSSDKPVARVLALKCPSSRRLKVVLGLLLLVSTPFSACKEVTGCTISLLLS